MLMWPWAGEAVCYKFERLPTERVRFSRLGAATSLGGIAHYGTDRTGRVESASDGYQCGVSRLGQPALGVRPQVGRIGSASPPDRPGTVGGSAAEETEAPLERSDGSDREPVEASTGCLTSGARSYGSCVVFPARSRSRGRVFVFGAYADRGRRTDPYSHHRCIRPAQHPSAGRARRCGRIPHRGAADGLPRPADHPRAGDRSAARDGPLRACGDTLCDGLSGCAGGGRRLGRHHRDTPLTERNAQTVPQILYFVPLSAHNRVPSECHLALVAAQLPGATTRRPALMTAI